MKHNTEDNGPYESCLHRETVRAEYTEEKRRRRQIRRTTSTEDEYEPTLTTKQSYKSLLLVSLSFFFTFTSYNALEGLQSSLNIEAGIGQVSVGVIYAVFISCSLTIAPIAVAKLTPRWTLLVSWVCYTLFTVANFYPTWWTMVPSAALLGVGAALVWIAQGVYVTSLALSYAAANQQCRKVTLARFNGIFFSIYALTMIIGNFVAAILLNMPSDSILKINNVPSENYNYSKYKTNISGHHHMQQLLIETPNLFANQTETHEEEMNAQLICGAHHCPYMKAHVEYIVQPKQTLVYALLVTFLACNILAILTTCFLDNPKASTPSFTICDRLSNTFSLLKNWRLLLLILPLISIRMFQSLSIGSYTLVNI